MKKLIFVLSALCLLLAPLGVAQAQGATVPEQLAYTDAQVAVFLPLLDDFQVGYYATNGTYYQALLSHSTPPVGVEPPTDPNARPTDQAEALAALWSYAGLPAALNWSFSVSTYSGDSGPGYVLNLLTVVDGQTWTKSINRGPETWRDQEWAVYVEGL